MKKIFLLSTIALLFVASSFALPQNDKHSKHHHKHHKHMMKHGKGHKHEDMKTDKKDNK